MRNGLLVLIAIVQISLIRSLKDTCNVKSGQHCNQMSESREAENDKMGQYLGLKEKEMVFPQTLEEFGYKFNEEGQMRNIETDEPFKFEVKQGDRSYNQKHYEALGEVITEYVYKLLEEEAKLKKHYIPVDAKEDEGKSFFFMSNDAMTSEKLIILIHGSGVVRAGQWARRLIINDDLKCGTMLQYIERASKEGYGVVITNGNDNYVQKNKKRIRIRGSESPEKHFVYVWDNFISKAAAQTMVVVAHSYGGIVIVEGLQHCKGIMDKVKAVAFTDSVHSLAHQNANKKFIKWMRRNSRNWVSTDLPLDAPVKSLFKGADCDMVSAGTVKHELTSYRALDSVFKFFDEKLAAPNNAESDISDDQADTSEHQAADEPDEPDEPEEPAEPAEPDEPEEPDEPDEPEEPDEPDEPAEPDEPDEPDASKNNMDSSQSQSDGSQMETDT